MKQAIVIYHNEKPIMVCELKSFVDTTEFIKKKKECEDNLKALLAEKAQKDQDYKELVKKVQELEHEIKVLKGVE